MYVAARGKDSETIWACFIGQPGQPTVAGYATAVEADVQGGGGGERVDGCGRLRRHGVLLRRSGVKHFDHTAADPVRQPHD